MSISLEKIILQNLIINEPFARQAIPHLKKDYFEDQANSHIFQVVNDYFNKSNQLPHKNIILIELKENEKINSKNLNQIYETVSEIFSNEPLSDVKWLLDQAEEWCRSKAMYLSIIKAISIYDGSDKVLLPSSIPEMMKDALSVSFNTNIGSDWLDDSENRYDSYQQPLNKIPFDLETLNDITLGGITRKTLSLILAGVHVGKTLSLVHLAAGYARLGYHVLYISMEMDENEILHRIDANMIKTPMHLIREMGKERFMKRIDLIKSKGYGKIKVIQFPTSAAHVGHFKNTINEMNMKMNWTPDVVMVDYIGCVASNRIKVGSTNSHFYLKSVAEEIRAMAIEYNVACWSAMQITRCISKTCTVYEKDKGLILSGDVEIGDSLQSNEGFNKVNKIHNQISDVYKIILEDDSSIICSGNHLFPVQNNELLSIETGLIIGDKLFKKDKNETKIVNIQKLGKEETVDFELDGNRLFYANNILTHNSGMQSNDVEMTDIAECVSLKTRVLKKEGSVYISCFIKDLEVGDIIKGYEKDVVVKRIFPVKKKTAIRITTKTGKSIICSMDHKIPTQRGVLSFKKGLTVGDNIMVDFI